MKKFLIGVLSVILLLSFSACDKNTPENSLKIMFFALKSGDEKMIDKLVDNTRTSLEHYLSDRVTVDDDIIEAFSDDDTYKILLKKMEYKINNATVKGDYASVPVSVTVVDMQKLLGKYLTESYSHIADGTWDQKAWINNEIGKDSAKTTTIKTNVNMVKSEGKWIIDKNADNEGLINALTGGLFNYAKSMLSAFNNGKKTAQ